MINAPNHAPSPHNALSASTFLNGPPASAHDWIEFAPGAEYYEDYRAPRVLRALYDAVAGDLRYAREEQGVILPPVLDLQLVDTTRETYAGRSDLLRGYRVLARDAIADKKHTGDLALEQAKPRRSWPSRT
nr:hypothetical protein [Sphingomonas sp. CDS-1]